MLADLVPAHQAHCPSFSPKGLGLAPPTSNQLEGTAEDIQGAHEQVEKSQEHKKLPNSLEDTENLPFGVSVCEGWE